jgi:hypothetical protein
MARLLLEAGVGGAIMLGRAREVTIEKRGSRWAVLVNEGATAQTFFCPTILRAEELAATLRAPLERPSVQEQRALGR